MSQRETFTLKYLQGVQTKHNRMLHKFQNIQTDLEVSTEVLINSTFDCEFNQRVGMVYNISGILSENILKSPKILRGN